MNIRPIRNDADYRAALAAVESLAAALAARPDVWQVEVLERPLDADPAAVLTGRLDEGAAAESAARAPAFRLRFVQALR
jgi:hypothetical protein